MICAKEELSLVTKKYIVQFNIKDNNYNFKILYVMLDIYKFFKLQYSVY